MACLERQQTRPDRLHVQGQRRLRRLRRQRRQRRRRLAAMESWGGDGGDAMRRRPRRRDLLRRPEPSDDPELPVREQLRPLGRSRPAPARQGTGNALPFPYGPARITASRATSSPSAGSAAAPSIYGSQTAADIKDTDVHGQPGLPGIRGDRSVQPAQPRSTSTPRAARVYSQAGNPSSWTAASSPTTSAARSTPTAGNAVDCNDCRFLGNEVIDRAPPTTPAICGSTISYILSTVSSGWSTRGPSRAAPSTWDRNCTRRQRDEHADSSATPPRSNGGAVRSLTDATFTDCVFGGNQARESRRRVRRLL